MWRRQRLAASADGCWHGKDTSGSLSLLLRFFQAQSPAGPLANPHTHTPPCLFHLSQSCSSFPATSIFPWAVVPRTGSQGEPGHHEGAWLRPIPPSLSSSPAVTHLTTGRGQENGTKQVPRGVCLLSPTCDCLSSSRAAGGAPGNSSISHSCLRDHAQLCSNRASWRGAVPWQTAA